MAREVHQFAVKVNAGTSQAPGVTTDLGMPSRIVRAITVRVPPGPRGMVGFTIGAAGTQLIPLTAGEWIVADDEELTWELDGYITSGAWQVTLYNNGQYNHEIMVRFELDLTTAPAEVPTLSVPLSAGVIETAGGVAPPTLPAPVFVPVPPEQAPPPVAPPVVPPPAVPPAGDTVSSGTGTWPRCGYGPAATFGGTTIPVPDGALRDWCALLPVETQSHTIWQFSSASLPGILVRGDIAVGVLPAYYIARGTLPLTVKASGKTLYLRRDVNNQHPYLLYWSYAASPPERGSLNDPDGPVPHAHVAGDYANAPAAPAPSGGGASGVRYLGPPVAKPPTGTRTT